MAVRRALILVVLLTTSATSTAWAQQCPAGTYLALDAWGNQVCKRLSDQSTAAVQVPPGQTCPAGAYPTVDNFGNQVCRTFQTPKAPQADYYDTSKGCPIGAYQTLDGSGNMVCKRF